MTYSERTLVAVARLLEGSDLDVERLLCALKQPSQRFGVNPADVYGEAVGEPNFPEGFVRIALDDVRWLRTFCVEALQVVEDRGASIDIERDEKAVWLLTALRDFCENALDLGVRPVVSRN